MKKFYAVVGNPPYQDQTIGDQQAYAAPIYHEFMDESFKVSDRVELITPARYLFNAGSTPKTWNRKILSDPHFKVLEYAADCHDYFPGQDIKGGVAVSLRDASREYGPIGTFVTDCEMRSILTHVKSAATQHSLDEIMYAPERYKFTEQMHTDHSEVEGMLSKGHRYDLKSNVLEKLDGIIFFDNKPEDDHEYVKIAGIVRNTRITKWIRKDYLKAPDNLNSYKVLLPKATGSGHFGERLPELIIAAPGIGHTQSFSSIGKFEEMHEAKSLEKYLKTKFVRALIGTLKVTQDLTSRVLEYVPLQDFGASSDIDWSQSVTDIDRQLYAKYGLSDDEIEFIESHVKEMD